MTWSKKEMALEVINLLTPNTSVNLGIGMPTVVAEYIPKNLNIIIHSENGVLGVDGRPSKNNVSPTLINAGKETISVNKAVSFFDSATSFGMIRGGHLDYAILGGMQVSKDGDLANWAIPGKKINGMGGAMDLVHGAKNIIVMMSHFSKAGESKLVSKCSLPLTGQAVVDFVVTDYGVFKLNKDNFETLKLSDPSYKNKVLFE